MRRVYNMLTNETYVNHSTRMLRDSDVVLHEDFKKELVTGRHFKDVRRDTMSRIIDIRVNETNQVETQLLVNKVKELNVFFDSTGDLVSDEMSDQLCEEYSMDCVINQVTSPSAELLSFIKQRIYNIQDIQYELLIELTNRWKELIFFVIQPALISALNVRSYIEHADYLFSGDNLSRLFVTAKYQLTKPYIHQLVSDFTSIPARNLLALSTVIMVPVLYLCYKIAYPTPITMSGSDKDQLRITIPRLNPPSFNNEYSESFKKFGLFVRNLSGEIGSIFGEVTSGMGLGYAGRVQQNMIDGFENSNTEVKLDVSNRTARIEQISDTALRKP